MTAASLAALREQLTSDDPDVIVQGAELLASLGDPDLAREVLAAIPPGEHRVSLRRLLGGYFPQVWPAQRDITLGGEVAAQLWSLRGPHQQIRSLTLKRSWVDIDLSALPALPDLETLRLTRLPLRDLSALPTLPRLRTLVVEVLPGLTLLDGLGRFPALENLSLRCCPQLRALGDLGALPGLRVLSLRSCPSLVRCEGLGGHPGLRCLRAHGAPAPEILRLPALRRLDLQPSSSPGAALPLDELAGSDALASVRIRRARVSGLGALAGKRLELDLVEVHLDDDRLPDLSAAVSVRLALRAPNLRSLAGLEAAALGRLDLRGCHTLTDVTALRGKRLRAVRLHNARKLRDLSPLAAVEGLEALSLSAMVGSEAASLERLGLVGLPALRCLSLTLSPGLRSLSGVETLPALRSLDLDRCRALRRFTGLDGLTRLEHLNLRRCDHAGPDAVRATGAEAARALAARVVSRQPEILTEVHKRVTQMRTSPASWPLAGCRRVSVFRAGWLARLPRPRDAEELTLCHAFEADLGDLGALPSLHTLRLDRLYRVHLRHLPTLAPQLRRLEVRACGEVVDWEGLASHPHLAELALVRCGGFGDLGAFTGLRTLRLDSLRARELRALPAGVTTVSLWMPVDGWLERMQGWAPQVRSLILEGAGTGRDDRALSGIERFTGLRELALVGTRVDSVAALRPVLPQLERIDLRGSFLPAGLRRVWTGAALAAALGGSGVGN